MKLLKPILILTGLLLAGCLALAVWLAGPSKGGGPVVVASSGESSKGVVEKAGYVGRARCASCHRNEHEQWTGSHHDLAMQEATAATVRGDFADASFTYHEVTSTFFRKGDEFHVRTDGPDGALHDYKIAYTFGVEPLQQYLIEFPGGRYQALNVCWDTRPKEAGGQRWFHLYPDEHVTADDILHWTGPYQNWNHMCAECHSTAVHKNYDAAKDSFATSWTEIDVSCESCHGPGSAHAVWAEKKATARDKTEPASSTKGWGALLREEKPGVWLPDPVTGIARRDIPRTSHTEIEMCARCHSRRGTFNEGFLPGHPPADTHRLALLTANLYEADGQIKDEVYEYGSFAQSRMYAAGVTCTDCHNPHTLKVVPGNNACARCHSAEKFDTPAHHFHTPGGKGSACVECHMPTRNYMVVHARHDHSMRVPRPDLTISLGTPNACNGCHADRTPQWAADEITRRAAPAKPKRWNFAEALSAARCGQPGADALLARLLDDSTQPAIARATAANMLEGSAMRGPFIEALRDADPLVRAAAVEALQVADPAELVKLLAPLMSDPVRQVRMDAARRLATAPEAMLTPGQQAARTRAMEEYLAAQRLDLDRAEARLNLGALHTERREFDAAEREYLAALRLSPRFPAAYVNLGDLYRQMGREADGIKVLRDGLTKATGSADIPHALGLALVRAHKLDEALPLLERATTLAPDVTHYAYIYGVALESAGPPGRGIEVLKQAHQRRPSDVEVLSALVAYARDQGRLDEAVEYAERMANLMPQDQEVRGMLEQLKAERARAVQKPPAK